MESEHLNLVVLDVEGKILSGSKNFLKLKSKGKASLFTDLVSDQSKDQFSELLDKLLNSPKEKKHVLVYLNRENPARAIPVWWEFSVVTNSEMDIIGLIGIGVGIPFLQQEMPWNNLVDLLQFGQIKFSAKLELTDWDQKSAFWIKSLAKQEKAKIRFEHTSIPFKKHLKSTVEHSDFSKGPVCFILKEDSGEKSYAALLMKTSEGYELFILPRDQEFQQFNSRKPYSLTQISAVSGAIWILDRDFNVVQQNQDAIKTGKIWNGKRFEEGVPFKFEQETKHYDKLLEYCKKALNGNSSVIELRVPNTEHYAGLWNVGIRPIHDTNGTVAFVVVHAVDLSKVNRQVFELQNENQALKELALKPSHILRSPLSSMLGLLDLIDQDQLDSENKKYFSYLKPLAKELDEVIRTNAKNMSAFD